MKKVIKKISIIGIIAIVVISTVGVASAGSGRYINAGTGKWSYGSTYYYNVWSQHENGTRTHSVSVNCSDYWRSSPRLSRYYPAYMSAYKLFCQKRASWNEY